MFETLNRHNILLADRSQSNQSLVVHATHRHCQRVLQCLEFGLLHTSIVYVALYRHRLMSHAPVLSMVQTLWGI